MHSSLKCIIADDNIGAIHVLTHYLSLHSDTKLLRSFLNPIKALSFLSTHQIDLIFLDVDMPDMNGMDFLSVIENSVEYGCPAVVLTTAHTEVALPALRSSKFTKGILCKPFGYNDFFTALEKIKSITHLDRMLLTNNELSENSENFLFVRTKSNNLTYHKIKKSEVQWIRGGRNYPIIHSVNGQHIVRATLKELASTMGEQLVRVHKSFLVNPSFIKSIHANIIIVQDGSEIPLSPTYREAFFKLLSLKN